jgi:putative ABC transport system ATP-binding protein
MMATMIYLEDITKTYHLGEIDVPVLKHIDLSILLTERLRQRVG